MSAANSHLNDVAKSQLDWPIEKRVRSIFFERFIYHEQINDIIKSCKNLMMLPRTVRPRGLVVSAPSGSGKTALAEALMRECRAQQATAERPATKPILYFSMSNAREAKEIFSRLLEALKCPHIRSFTAADLRKKALDLSRAASLRLLIVDEIQDVLFNTVRQQGLALVAIKDIMNTLKVPVLALGTGDARNALSADEHLQSRFKPRELPVWRCDEYFRHFLQAYEETLPLRDRSNLGTQLMMKLLIKETEGQLSEIVERVQRAAGLAIETGIERITQDLILRARFDFPQLMSDSDE
jgi:hypothetical protein